MTCTICIVSLSLTTQRKLLTQTAQPCRWVYFVDITTACSWCLECNIHCWVILLLSESVATVFLLAKPFWNWRVWLGGVQFKFNWGKERTQPWMVLSRSQTGYRTQMLSNSCMIPGWASVYFTMQSSKRYCTDDTTAKNISDRPEWLRGSGCVPSEMSETPCWRMMPRPASVE